jgi:hypothetical protein
MDYPNKIFVCEYKGTRGEFKDVLIHSVIVVVAPNSETAKEYVKEQIGFEAEPVWLINALYPTIYDNNGNKPLDKQVKILSNNKFYVDLSQHK